MPMCSLKPPKEAYQEVVAGAEGGQQVESVEASSAVGEGPEGFKKKKPIFDQMLCLDGMAKMTCSSLL